MYHLRGSACETLLLLPWGALMIWLGIGVAIGWVLRWLQDIAGRCRNCGGTAMVICDFECSRCHHLGDLWPF